MNIVPYSPERLSDACSRGVARTAFRDMAYPPCTGSVQDLPRSRGPSRSQNLGELKAGMLPKSAIGP